MAVKRPLVRYADTGQLEELRAGDTLPGAGGGGSTSASVVTVDFGTSQASRSKTFNVPLAGAVVGAKVLASPSLDMPADVSVDEFEMDAFVVAGRVVQTGEVQLTLHSLGAPLSRQRNVNVVLA